MGLQNITNFIFELGNLRNVKSEGWRLLNVKDPESVAEHCLRAAQIGFILAKLENYESPYEIVTMLVFHDIDNTRVGNIHKVARRYLQIDKETLIKEQTRDLEQIGLEIQKLFKSVSYLDSGLPGIIAQDANYLEMAVTAKEYLELGYKEAQNWLDSINKRLQTKSARDIFNEMQNTNSTDWWKDLKKREYPQDQ